MGSIPAPNIAELGGQIAAAPMNQAAEYARVAALNQQTQQAQAMAPGAQQLQSQQIQAQQQQLADQKALTAAWSQYDPSKNSDNDPYGAQQIQGLILKNGGSGQAAQQMQQHFLQLKDTASQIAQRDAGTGEKNLANMKAKNDQALGIIQSAESVPDEQLGDHLSKALAQAQQQGVLDPQHYQNGQQLLTLPPDQMRTGLKAYENSLRTGSQIFDEAQKQEETKAKQTTAAAEQTKANAAQWKDFPELGVSLNTATGEQRSVTGANGPVMSPAMMENKFVQLAAKQNQGQPLDPSDKAWMQGYQKYKTLVPIANFNLQNSGASADAGGNPSAIAQALANNTMKWSEAVSPRTPQSIKNSIMAQVFKLNPNYDTSEFGLETDAAKKARSGAWADTRLGYNTAIDHAQQLLAASDALQNGNVQQLNKLKNYFATQFGSPGPITAQAIANAYNHEVTSVVAKGHMTDAEVAQGHGTMDVNAASPEQMHGVAQAYLNLMTSKRDELDKIIKGTAGNKATGVTNVQSNSDSTPKNDFFSQFGGKARPNQ